MRVAGPLDRVRLSGAAPTADRTMRKRKGSDRVAALAVLAVVSVVCAVLLAAHYRDLSFSRIGIFLAISVSVAALIAIPWLLIRGSTLPRLLARAGAATLLLTAVGYVLMRVSARQGEEGTLLAVLVNIGAVFGLVSIIGLLVAGLARHRRRGE